MGGAPRLYSGACVRERILATDPHSRGAILGGDLKEFRRSNIDQLAQIHAFVRAMPPPVVDGSQADFVAPAGRGRSARSSPHGSRNGATARKTVIIYMLAMRSRIDRKFAK